jgi:hypothetical protein
VAGVEAPTPPERQLRSSAVGEESLIDLPLDPGLPQAADGTGDIRKTSETGPLPRSAGPLRWLPLAMLLGGLMILGLAWAHPGPLAKALNAVPGFGPRPSRSAIPATRPIAP